MAEIQRAEFENALGGAVVLAQRGAVFLQGLQLGLLQLAISLTVNLGVVLSAAWLATRLARYPRWLAAQRYVMGSVLAGLALRLALDPQPARAAGVLR